MTLPGQSVVARAHRLSVEEFRRDYFAVNRPVVVSGWVDDWPALARWTPDFFRTRYPDVPVEVEVLGPDEGPELYYRGRPVARTSMSDACERIASSKPGRPIYYLCRCRILDKVPELASDLRSLAAYYRVEHAPELLTRRLTNGPIFWMGPADATTPIHFDSAPNLVVQIQGHKRWTLYEPDQAGNLHYPHREFLDGLVRDGFFPYLSPVDPSRPDLERFPRFREARSVTFDVGPGEVVFVPACHWHHVRSLDTSISINYWRASLATAKYVSIYRLLRLRASAMKALRSASRSSFATR